MWNVWKATKIWNIIKQKPIIILSKMTISWKYFLCTCAITLYDFICHKAHFFFVFSIKCYKQNWLECFYYWNVFNVCLKNMKKKKQRTRNLNLILLNQPKTSIAYFSKKQWQNEILNCLFWFLEYYARPSHFCYWWEFHFQLLPMNQPNYQNNRRLTATRFAKQQKKNDFDR